MSSPAGVLSFAEASAMVREYARSFPAASRPVEEVALAQALERVLAEAVVADRDQPPFPRATRDGFAGRAADWAAGNLPLDGLLRAGERWTHGSLARGVCIEIMTGAPVPPGADCVVMLEHVQRSEAGVALLSNRSIAAGDNIVPQGAEAGAGSPLLAVGERARPAGIAAAAGSGAARVRVYKKPRVAILATGDELVPLDGRPEPWQIRNSNSHSLAAQVASLGGESLLYPPVPDDPGALDAAIAEAVETSDLLLLSGGVSMGRFDLVEPALERHGAEFRFTGVRMQPGKPLVFGTMQQGRLPFFGLPGNPVSTMVCFSLFAAPVLAALGGEVEYQLPWAHARSTSLIPGKSGLTRFLPARLERSIDAVRVQPVAWQGSGDTTSVARSNCLVVVPENATLQPGEFATVLLL